LDSFIQFAVKLGDGEASCLAIAKSGGWTIARRASLLRINALTSAPELIRKWVDARQVQGNDRLGSCGGCYAVSC